MSQTTATTSSTKTTHPLSLAELATIETLLLVTTGRPHHHFIAVFSVLLGCWANDYNWNEEALLDDIRLNFAIGQQLSKDLRKEKQN